MMSPFSHMQCHLIGVVPKKDPRCTILHLSYPEVNDFIPKADYMLHYVTVDTVIETLGSGPGLAR